MMRKLISTFSTFKIAKDKSLISNIKECKNLQQIANILDACKDSFTPRISAVTARKLSYILHRDQTSPKKQQIIFNFINSIPAIDLQYLTPQEKFAILYFYRAQFQYLNLYFQNKLEEIKAFRMKLIHQIFSQFQYLNFNKIVDFKMEIMELKMEVDEEKIQQRLIELFPQESNDKVDSIYHIFLLGHWMFQKQGNLSLLQKVIIECGNLAQAAPIGTKIRLLQLISRQPRTKLKSQLTTLVHKFNSSITQDLIQVNFQGKEEMMNELRAIKDKIEMNVEEINEIIGRLALLTNKIKKIRKNDLSQ